MADSKCNNNNGMTHDTCQLATRDGIEAKLRSILMNVYQPKIIIDLICA